MKARILRALLIISPLIVYWEWGGNNSTFLLQAEYEVIVKLFSDFLSHAHPLTLIPLAGQLLILIAIFHPKPNKWFTYIGIACMGLLLGLLTLIGLIGFSYITILSTVPFWVMVVLVIRQTKSSPELA